MESQRTADPLGGGRTRSAHSLQILQRKQTMRKAAQEAIAQIEDEYSDHRDGVRADIPSYQQLSEKAIDVKEAILDHFIKKTLSPFAFSNITRHMKLGKTDDDSRLRQKALNYLVGTNNLSLLATGIADFNPSEKDIPYLIHLGRKIAIDENEDFPSYLSILHGISKIPLNPEYEPLQLPLDDKLDLIQTWLLHSPSQISGNSLELSGIYSFAYSKAERTLGDDGLFSVRSEKIPAFMQELHNSLVSHSASPQAISKWLGYSTAHLIGTVVSESRQRLLQDAYRALSSCPEERLQYGGSQIIGKTMQSSSDTERLFLTLDRFNDHVFGILFHAAAGDDADLSLRFSILLNQHDTRNDPRFRSTLIGFAVFADSDRIDARTKQRVLNIVADAFSGDLAIESAISIMQTLGKIGTTINDDSSKLSDMYQWWLPQCESVDQLKNAASPDQAFLARLVEMQIVARVHGVDFTLGELEREDSKFMPPAIPLAPVSFSDSEKLNFAKRAVREWVKTSSVNELVDDAAYVALSVFLNPTEYGLLETEKIAENCPMLKEVAARAIERHDESTYRWTQLAALLMLDTEDSVRNSPFFVAMLNGVAKFHGGETRLPTTLCLFHATRDAQTAAQFESFSARFVPAHSRIFAAPLFRLTDNGAHADQLGKLMTTVKDRRFKDTKKALPLLKFISEMAEVRSIVPKDKCALVKMLTDGAAKVTADVTPAMIYVLGLAKLADAGTEDSEKALNALNDIDNVSSAGGRILFEVFFSISPAESDEILENYERYLKTSRNPAALLSFATSIYTGIKAPDERKKVMNEIFLMVKGLVANDDGSTLKQIRYSIEGNHHNALLLKEVPVAWETWKEEMEWETEIEYTQDDLNITVNTKSYLKEKIIDDCHVESGTFPLLELALRSEMPVEEAVTKLEERIDCRYKNIERQLLLSVLPGASKEDCAAAIAQLAPTLPFPQLSRDIADLRKKLTAPPLSREKCKKLHASVSSKPEDLFLTGTEVIGSCQSVHGVPALNKALPGFVLDGKYLSAQVTNENGSLMARRMLRLLWSEEHNKPVIFVEREYSNPGVPQKIRDACLQLVRTKAEKMGALLATDDAEIANDKGRRIGWLHAYRTPRPYDYVDALGGIQEYGEYMITDAQPVKDFSEVTTG